MDPSNLAWLLDEEKEKQAQLLAQCFGYYLLFFSLQGPALIPHCPIKQSFVVSPQRLKMNEKADVIADWLHLPFSPGAIDLIVLSHVFDCMDHPEALLKEVNLILRHDGKLLLSGFNPGRLRARNLAKCYHAGASAEKGLQLRLCSSVMFMLQNAGFEIIGVRHYGFFGLKNRRWTKYLNRFCQKFFPGLACGYLIFAQKKLLGAVAAKPDWQRSLLEPEKLRAPTSCRVK